MSRRRKRRHYTLDIKRFGLTWKCNSYFNFTCTHSEYTVTFWISEFDFKSPCKLQIDSHLWVLSLQTTIIWYTTIGEPQKAVPWEFSWTEIKIWRDINHFEGPTTRYAWSPRSNFTKKQKFRNLLTYNRSCYRKIQSLVLEMKVNLLHSIALQ